jgi:hypothetical protein
MDKDAVDIRFDNSGCIRVLASSDHDHSVSMANKSDDFISSKLHFFVLHRK